MSMCLVLSWNTGLQCGLTVAKELHMLSVKTPSDARKVRIQTSSLVATAIARYLASAKDLQTVACFLVIQETGAPPSVTK